MKSIQGPTTPAAILIVLSLISALLPATSQAGEGAPAKELRGSSSGPNSERVKLLPITRGAGEARHSVISLDPDRLGRIEGGAKIRVSSEITLSTTCTTPGPRCHGSIYRYDPIIGARLILAGRAGATAGRKVLKLSDRVTVACGQGRPNRNHHCPITIDEPVLQLPDRLPCRPRRCRINLVVDVHHPRAGGDDLLIVGADEPDGSIDQGKGRVQAVVFRAGPGRPDAYRRSTARQSRVITMGASRSGGHVVSHSVRLPKLQRGDVVAASTLQLTDIDHLPYAAFVSNRLVVASDPGAVKPDRSARRIIGMGGYLTQANGFNCTQGPSGYRTTCASRKAGLARAIRPTPRGTELYLNVVTRSFPKLTSARPGDAAKILAGGFAAARIFRP